MFTVEVEKTKNVGDLKKLIVKKKAHRLNHIDASDLDLWMVDLPLDDRFQASLPRDDHVDATQQILLNPLLSLSKVFKFHYLKGSHVHVIVRAPTNGEVIWAGINNLIDVVQRVLRREERGEIRSVL